ncbi:uncharacterized protein LOC114935497 [Nylanderia fulva]|uniref:uncharacterized protein LOC114935497 n=1 Tax=Nylanderia fulva TaxID=613905 RepID=UPI0010FADF57|nr:uncharacterized protein LOC114935497 [Nylanderia fulva]
MRFVSSVFRSYSSENLCHSNSRSFRRHFRHVARFSGFCAQEDFQLISSGYLELAFVLLKKIFSSKTTPIYSAYLELTFVLKKIFSSNNHPFTRHIWQVFII